MGGATLTSFLLVVSGLALGGALAAPSQGHHGGPSPPAISHVVVIMMENAEIATVLHAGSYERYLWNTYGQVSNFYGACHYSLPEYLALTSGRSYTCTSVPILGDQNLADLLEKKGDSWAAYAESMPSACDIHSSGPYVSYHVPFLFYKDIRYYANRCDAHVVNSMSFNTSVLTGSLPAYAFYVPNTADDGEFTTVQAGDQWLNGFLAPILNSSDPLVVALLKSTAFLVVFDEGSTNLGYSVPGVVSSWCQNKTGQPLAVCGGHTYMVVVSPFSQHTHFAPPATEYNVQSTVEWLFGLGSDGGNDGTGQFPAMTSLFQAPPPPHH